MAAKKYTPMQYVVILIAVLLMFLTAVIPPFTGLSQAGFQVLGILIGGLLLWLFVGVDWTSFLILLALMTVPSTSMAPTLVRLFFSKPSSRRISVMMGKKIMNVEVEERKRLRMNSATKYIAIVHQGDFLPSLLVTNQTATRRASPVLVSDAASMKQNTRNMAVSLPNEV